MHIFASHPELVYQQVSSFILRPSSCILHPSSFILHPSSFIFHPPSSILHPPSFPLLPPLLCRKVLFLITVTGRELPRKRHSRSCPTKLASQSSFFLFPPSSFLLPPSFYLLPPLLCRKVPFLISVTGREIPRNTHSRSCPTKLASQ
jgi:hypothetical protein